MPQKLQSLLYFEAIVVSSNVANRLINSEFVVLFMELLRVKKSPVLRVRLCSILGQLIRHSTVIENELAESGVCQLLVESVGDKNEKVRRKAISALGEYLFYAATQLDDEQADPCWEIPQSAISMVTKVLRTSEDEVVRFYACKTLENITAQSVLAG